MPPDGLRSPIIEDHVPNHALRGTILAVVLEADTRREETGSPALHTDSLPCEPQEAVTPGLGPWLNLTFSFEAFA